MDHENPLVSILIPTFNGRRHLSDAIQSALSQTYPRFEIIVCDDGSADRSVELAEELLSSSGRPHQVKSFEHAGMIQNWNRCLELSAGIFLKFLFQDDRLAPDCIDFLVQVARESDRIAFVFCPRTPFLDVGSADDPICQKLLSSIATRPVDWNAIPGIVNGEFYLRHPALLSHPLNKFGEPTALLIRKSVLVDRGGFDLTMGQVADLEAWLRLLPESRIGYVDKSLVSIRIHSGQETVRQLRTGDHAAAVARLDDRVGRPEFWSQLHAWAKVRVRMRQVRRMLTFSS